MKTMLLRFALAGLSAAALFAQDPKGGQVLIESQASKTEKEEKKPPVTPAKTTNVLFGTPVTYGGYLSDLKKAENKRALFNLKPPNNPQKDTENLWFSPRTDNVYPGTDKPQGVILF